jgi:hypothetical protein
LDGHDVIIARLHIISFHIILTLIKYFVCPFPSISLRLALWSPQYPQPQIQPCNPNHEIPPILPPPITLHMITLYSLPPENFKIRFERKEIKKKKFIFSRSPPRAPRSYLLRTPVLCGSHSPAQRIRSHPGRPRVRITTVHHSDQLFNPG